RAIAANIARTRRSDLSTARGGSAVAVAFDSESMQSPRRWGVRDKRSKNGIRAGRPFFHATPPGPPAVPARSVGGGGSRRLVGGQRPRFASGRGPGGHGERPA